MPKIDATYGQLMLLRDDILRLQNESAAFFYFNKARNDRFFSQNHMHLSILNSRLSEFIKNHVQHDENQQPVTELKENVAHYVFPSPAEKEKYIAARNKFLSLKITMEL